MAGYYELLGVASDAPADTVRAAYRELARHLHPDRSGDDSVDAQRTMALVNEAWVVLSDPASRAAYDLSLAPPARTPDAHSPGGATTVAPVSRRDQWFGGLRVQVVRLGAEAARSASLTLSMRRHGHKRSVYDATTPSILDHLGRDTEARVRSARELGSAPLDLGLTTLLIGLRSFGAEIGRRALDPTIPVGVETLASAEMIDRMWDTTAHELRHDIVQSLGGNPHIHRWLSRR